MNKSTNTIIETTLISLQLISTHQFFVKMFFGFMISSDSEYCIH